METAIGNDGQSRDESEGGPEVCRRQQRWETFDSKVQVSREEQGHWLLLGLGQRGHGQRQG